VFTAVYANPVTEGAFVDTELLRHSGNRARRLDHHLHGFILKFRREALLRSRQLPHLSRHPSYWMDCPEASGHPNPPGPVPTDPRPPAHLRRLAATPSGSRQRADPQTPHRTRPAPPAAGASTRRTTPRLPETTRTTLMAAQIPITLG